MSAEICRVRFAPNGVFTYAGRNYARGALLRLKGARHDEKLLRLGFLTPYTDSRVWECGQCGDLFSSGRLRDEHVKEDHNRGEQSPIPEEGSVAYHPQIRDGGGTIEGNPTNIAGGVEDDSHERRREQQNVREEPLFMENTAASRDAGYSTIDLGITQPDAPAVASEAAEQAYTASQKVSKRKPGRPKGSKNRQTSKKAVKKTTKRGSKY